jgi:hypothetical protein
MEVVRSGVVMRLGVAVITIVDGGTARGVVRDGLFDIDHDWHRLFHRLLLGRDLLSLLLYLRWLLYLFRLIVGCDLFGVCNGRNDGNVTLRHKWSL